MNEHEDNLRDLAAMFAMMGMLASDRPARNIPEHAYDLADAFMEIRAERLADEVEDGIAAITPKRKRATK